MILISCYLTFSCCSKKNNSLFSSTIFNFTALSMKKGILFIPDMTDKRNIYDLLADEEFQEGILHFNSFDREKKRDFIERYSIERDELTRAGVIINGLCFKEETFSQDEINYLWERFEKENALVPMYAKSGKRRIWGWFTDVAAILFIPLFIVSIWYHEKTRKSEALRDESMKRLYGMYNTVVAPPGGKTRTVLPDGSEVWLNSGSTIRYPVLDKPGTREVEMSGEGFFKVIRNPDKPMVITTSGIQVKVWGTTFNIRAYDDDPFIETALVEGNISLVKQDERSGRSGNEIVLKPGEIGRYNRRNNTIDVAALNNPEVYTGWINGKYVFKNTQFKEILKRFERMHNVEFVLEDITLGDYRFDATFDDQNIDRIMEIFAVSLPMKWKTVYAVKRNDNSYSTRRIILSRDKKRKI